MAAPSQDHAKPECPWAAPQGRKWSEDMAQSKPAAPAARARASSSEGGNCSYEAWKPMCGRAMRSPGTERRGTRGAAPGCRPHRRMQLCCADQPCCADRLVGGEAFLTGARIIREP